MKEIKSLKSLGCILSKLDHIKGVNRGLEQYQTPSEVASEIIWNAMLNRDITDNIIYDLGCGNGIFGIGALLTGAAYCVFLELDVATVELCKRNLNQFSEIFKSNNEYIIINENVNEFKDKIKLDDFEFENKDEFGIEEQFGTIEKVKKVVLMNPPFGTKRVHADREFLVKAFEFADVIYSLHMKSTVGFLDAVSTDNNFKITHRWEYDFGIKRSHEMHKKDYHEVPVICVRMERISK